MKTYKVLRDCVGFKGRYWEKDMVVTFEDEANPPEHFQLIGKTQEKEAPVKKTEGTPLKDVPTSPKIPNTGFAHGYKGAVPQKEKTAGEALKHDKGKRKNKTAKKGRGA